ncbi:hypothetical protein [Sansalvadorimonas verongulae]|uniref:hypothetical protein n=1 Tax=Sansalvadorimonas verongulae TaxID=2172824 RepID=UPI0012BC27EB|nr:hypothetical protein [Sansalvadorimonas verongulae]MTI13205.1 hypothetical protein [Sansalvadorimonas verongulae]
MESARLKTHLSVPKCKRDTLTFAKPNNDSVRQWIRNLPKANLGEMARQLYFALQEMNQVPLPASKRLSFLELLRPSIHYTCRTLARHYLKKPITLTARERKIANLAQSLQSHLLTGYKMVVVQQMESEPSEQDQTNLIIAVHRAINESCYFLLRCYQLYCDTPKLIWKELHSLYHLAEDYKIAQTKVEDHENQVLQQISIADSYKRALLLSRARPNMLRQMELDQLFRVLEKWSGSASLSNKVSDSTLFAINIESDKAPVYSVDIAIEDPTLFRGLETQHLAEDLKNSTGSDSDAQIPATLLNHLTSAWGAKTSRHHHRKHAAGKISFAAGLSGTHFYLGNETPFHTMLTEDFGELPLTDAQQSFHADDGDVWDHVSGAVPSGMHIARMKGDSIVFNEDNDTPVQKYPIFQASLIDTSPGGYCAYIDGSVPQQIQTGELISLRSPGGLQWILATIRWIRLEGSERVVFGIQLLSPNAHPTAASVLRKKRSCSDFMRCFYLPEFKELNEPAALITPRVPFQIGSKVRFFNGKKFIQAVLTECTLSTGSFCQFLFNPVDSTLSQTASSQKKPQKKLENSLADDDFNALWKDL